MASVNPITIVEWQCFGTKLPPAYYVTLDINVAQKVHPRNGYALNCSYIYCSESLKAAQAYVRGVEYEASSNGRTNDVEKLLRETVAVIKGQAR